MKTPSPIKISIEIKVTTDKDHYTSVSVAEKEVKTMLTLDMDAPKRKIIDALDSEIQAVFNDLSRLIHHSSVLTDGEQRREREAEEKS